MKNTENNFIGFSLVAERVEKKNTKIKSIKIVEKQDEYLNKTRCYYAAKNALQNYFYCRKEYSWLEGLTCSLANYLQTNYAYPKSKSIEFEDADYLYSLKIQLLFI